MLVMATLVVVSSRLMHSAMENPSSRLPSFFWEKPRFIHSQSSHAPAVVRLYRVVIFCTSDSISAL